MKRFLIIAATTLICLTAHAQGQYKDWANFTRYAKANDSITVKPKVVFMGDSITDNWVKKDGDFFSTNNFAGRGISGQTTSQMLIRFRSDVIDLAPKYVVILAGTNDIAKNTGEISLENILGNIESMCELAKAHKIKPILCSVLPAASYSWRKEIEPAGEILKFNDMLRQYAKENRIPYIDYHSVLKDEQNGLPKRHAADGVHPNLDCYKIMEEIILKYL
jgi:lysophospholipase L1-like esterase